MPLLECSEVLQKMLSEDPHWIFDTQVGGLLHTSRKHRKKKQINSQQVSL